MISTRDCGEQSFLGLNKRVCQLFFLRLASSTCKLAMRMPALCVHRLPVYNAVVFYKYSQSFGAEWRKVNRKVAGSLQVCGK